MLTLLSLFGHNERLDRCGLSSNYVPTSDLVARNLIMHQERLSTSAIMLVWIEKSVVLLACSNTSQCRPRKLLFDYDR